MMKNLDCSMNFIVTCFDFLKTLSLISILTILIVIIPTQVFCAEENRLETSMQELMYDIGMNLAHQPLIQDKVSIKHALLHVYDEIAEVKNLFNSLMMFDEELVDLNITTVEELIDFELENKESMVQAGIILLAAYQNLFILFQDLHKDDYSFDVWRDIFEFFVSLEEFEEPADPGYLQLWYACCSMLEAQHDFEIALGEAE